MILKKDDKGQLIAEPQDCQRVGYQSFLTLASELCWHTNETPREEKDRSI